MATLQERVAALAGRIRDQFNTIKPRLMPLAGATGSVLTKTSAADNAAAWISPPYGFAFACAGKPTAGEVFGPWVADRAFTLPNGLTTSIARAGAAFTASAVWTLKRNGTAIGTVTFSAGSVAGVLASSTSADIPIARSDVLTLTAPDPVDASGADIGFTFVGVR